MSRSYLLFHAQVKKIWTSNDVEVNDVEVNDVEVNVCQTTEFYFVRTEFLHSSSKAVQIL